MPGIYDQRGLWMLHRMEELLIAECEFGQSPFVHSRRLLSNELVGDAGGLAQSGASHPRVALRVARS